MSSTVGRRAVLRGGMASLALLAGGGILTGCGKPTPADQGSTLTEWLSKLDGVATARVMTTPSASGGDPDVAVVVTTTKALPDDRVAALVGTIRKGWDSHGGDVTTDLTLQLDGFAAHVYPHETGVADTYLTRALWLRRDGRAVSGAYAGDDGLYHVTAKAADVAAVVLGINALERSQVSLTTVVTSTDGMTAARWSDSATGIAVDADFVRKVDALGKQYAGLAWWADFSGKRGGLYFPATGPTLDQVRAAAGSYANGTQLTTLELGRGVARADSTLFAKAFAPGTTFRRLADAAQRLPGVTRVQLPAKVLPGDSAADVRLQSVVVADRSGFVAATTTLPKVWDDYLPITLIRGPGVIQSDLVVDPGLAQEVFRSSAADDRAARNIYLALADVPGVTEVAIGPTFANLTVASDVGATDLTAALRAVRTLPTIYSDDGVKTPYVIHLYESTQGHINGLLALADIRAGTFGAPRRVSRATPSAAERALTQRARSIWQGLR